MSANRRRSGDEPWVDCPGELTFEQFIERCAARPIVRVQGKVRSATKRAGRLVRFNRSVRVLVETAATNAAGHPYVRAERVRWDWREERFVPTGRYHTLTWAQLDWVTWQVTGDPNGTWIKVL